MIHFYRVTKFVTHERTGNAILLHNVDISIPLDLKVALLGRKAEELTTLLHLLAGSETPDSGHVVVDPIRRSPIINAGRNAGGALVRKLTALQNIEFFAGINGIETGRLVALVEAVCRLKDRLRLPVAKLAPVEIRCLELALLTAIPYDCYFVDRFHELKGHLLWRLLHAVRGRRAGLIFASNRMSTAAHYAQIGAFVGNGTVCLFPQVTMAIKAYEQQK
jgi:ABC-type polysaccharide/polyol phosphate transport system ATPase subunit